MEKDKIEPAHPVIKILNRVLNLSPFQGPCLDYFRGQIELSLTKLSTLHLFLSFIPTTGLKTTKTLQ